MSSLQFESTDDTTPAAKVRVKAEELTAALNTLDAQKAQALEGTLPIGQAVEELNLEATPEQIWAEVQRQRLASEKAKTAPNHRTSLLRLLQERALSLFSSGLANWNVASPMQRTVGLSIPVAALLGTMSLTLKQSHHSPSSNGSSVISGSHSNSTVAGHGQNVVVSGSHDRIRVQGTVGRI